MDGFSGTNQNVGQQPLPTGAAVAVPPAPMPQKLKTEEIEVTEPGKTIKYLLISLSVTVIVGSLLTAYLQSAKGASANQNEKKYATTVESTLNSAQFKSKEEAVQNIGTQVSSLQSALASRVIYSQFFKELEKALYKGTRLSKVVINRDGLVTVEGVTNNFSDLAKTVDALNSAGNFNSVELVSAQKQQDGVVSFMISMAVDKSLLSIKSSGATANQ